MLHYTSRAKNNQTFFSQIVLSKERKTSSLKLPFEKKDLIVLRQYITTCHDKVIEGHVECSEGQRAVAQGSVDTV